MRAALCLFMWSLCGVWAANSVLYVSGPVFMLIPGNLVVGDTLRTTIVSNLNHHLVQVDSPTDTMACMASTCVNETYIANNGQLDSSRPGLLSAPGTLYFKDLLGNANMGNAFEVVVMGAPIPTPAPTPEPTPMPTPVPTPMATTVQTTSAAPTTPPPTTVPPTTVPPTTVVATTVVTTTAMPTTAPVSSSAAPSTTVLTAGATTTNNAGSTTDNAGSTTDNAGSTTDNAGSTTDNAGSTTDNAGSTTDNAVSTSAAPAATTAPGTTVDASTTAAVVSTTANPDAIFGGSCGPAPDCNSCLSIADPNNAQAQLCGWCDVEGSGVCQPKTSNACSQIQDTAFVTGIMPNEPHDDCPIANTCTGFTDCEACAAETDCQFCLSNGIGRCVNNALGAVCSAFDTAIADQSTCPGAVAATTTPVANAPTTSADAGVTTTSDDGGDNNNASTTDADGNNVGEDTTVDPDSVLERPFTETTEFLILVIALAVLCCCCCIIILVVCLMRRKNRDIEEPDSIAMSSAPYDDGEQPQRLEVEWIDDDNSDASDSTTSSSL